MYIHSDSPGNPTSSEEPILHCPIRDRKELEEGEVDRIELTPKSYDLHTMMDSRELKAQSRFGCSREGTHLGF